MTTTLCDRSPRRRALLGWIAGLLTVAILLAACGGRGGTPTTGEILAQYLPSDWSFVTTDSSVEGFQSVTIDGDDENEWLLFYHYDSPPDQTNGPIGGIIYDVQQDTQEYNPDVTIPFPFQPAAFFVPYRLLPDWTPGKGQGYLGDINVTWEPIAVPKTLERANELLVQGTGANDRITRVSIFRWGGPTQGYSVAYFQGSFSASIEAGRKSGDVVNQVVTLNALNDRSNMCEQQVWTRQGDSISFNPSSPTIVFCQGTPPEQPTYPEAVVLTYLLTQNTDLILEERVPQVQSVVPAKVDGVVTLAYPGTATVTGTGVAAESRMVVETLVEDGGSQSMIRWQLQELRSNSETMTTRWRIESAQKG